MEHKDIIQLWDSPRILADEIGQKYNTVMQWKQRNSIPAEHWTHIVKSAKKEDLPVTYRLLAENYNP